MLDSRSQGTYVSVASELPRSLGENLAFFDAEPTPPELAAGTISQSETPLEGENHPESETRREGVAYSLEGLQHNTLEGTSSRMASEPNLHGGSSSIGGDIEQQGDPHVGRLSAANRLKNVAQYLFPFKQTYERLHNGLSTGRLQLNAPGRFVGQGTDGVFRNLTAKPDTELSRAGQEQHPPTYDEAAADASPEYWEATMISPMYEDEVFVHGLPVGNIANFVWNILVSVAFQLVGFVLCYLLHTSHASKQGTRAGLGITIIMYGYSVIPANFGRPDKVPTRYEPSDPNLIDISKSLLINAGGAVDNYLLGFVQNSDANGVQSGAQSPMVAYGIMALGILIFLKSFVDFYYIKKEEKRVLAPRALEEVHTTTEAVDSPPSS